MTWGMANLWKEGKEGQYAVQHSQRPVNDFGRPRQKGMRMGIFEREHILVCFHMDVEG